MKMRTLAVAAALGVVAAVAGAQDVKTDYDHAADFSKIKSFDIKIGTGWNNSISEKRVLDEIAQSLTEKGWSRSTDSPDAVVVLHGATDVKKSLDTFYTGGYGGYGWRGWGGGMGSSTTNVREYAVGTLVVDIFDSKSKSLMFRGTATDELSDKPEKNQKKLAKASDKMFKEFPPGSAKK